MFIGSKLGLAHWASRPMAHNYNDKRALRRVHRMPKRICICFIALQRIWYSSATETRTMKKNGKNMAKNMNASKKVTPESFKNTFFEEARSQNFEWRTRYAGWAIDFALAPTFASNSASHEQIYWKTCVNGFLVCSRCFAASWTQPHLLPLSHGEEPWVSSVNEHRRREWQ